MKSFVEELILFCALIPRFYTSYSYIKKSNYFTLYKKTVFLKCDFEKGRAIYKNTFNFTPPILRHMIANAQPYSSQAHMEFTSWGAPLVRHMKFSQPIMVSIIQAVNRRLTKILVCHLDELLVFAGHS